MAKIIVSGMKYKKGTKGTVVFEATADEAAVPVIYIKKHAVPDANDVEALRGKTVTLTIEMA